MLESAEMPSRSFPPLDPNPRNQLSIACKFRKYCERSRENLHTKKKRKGASFYASFFCHKLGSKQTEIPSHLQLPVQYLTICRCNFCLFLPFIIYMLCVLPGISSLLISTLPVHSPAFFQTSHEFFPVLAVAGTGSCVGPRNKMGHRAPRWR